MYHYTGTNNIEIIFPPFRFRLGLESNIPIRLLLLTSRLGYYLGYNYVLLYYMCHYTDTNNVEITFSPLSA